MGGKISPIIELTDGGFLLHSHSPFEKNMFSFWIMFQKNLPGQINKMLLDWWEKPFRLVSILSLSEKFKYLNSLWKHNHKVCRIQNQDTEKKMQINAFELKCFETKMWIICILFFLQVGGAATTGAEYHVDSRTQPTVSTLFASAKNSANLSLCVKHYIF